MSNDLDLTPAEKPTEKPTFRRLFFGAQGLRAGWGVLVYILLVALTGYLIQLALHALHIQLKPSKLGMTPGLTTVAEGIQFATLLIPAILMSLIEKRPFTRYGLATRRWFDDVVTGLLWGLVNISLLMIALLAFHAISFDGIAERGNLALTSGLEWFAAFLLVGFFEEFFFRGYLQYTVSRGVAAITRAISPATPYAYAIGFWIAAALFSVAIFMLAHIGNTGETPAGIVAVGLAGLVLVFSLWRTGSLWWAIGWHCAWDWGQSCLFGTADSGNAAQHHILNSHPIGPILYSGGSAGPEASILVIPALLLAAVIIYFTLPMRSYPLTRDQAPPTPPVID